MARAATKIDDSAASACGRLIALYSRFLVREITTQVLFVTPLGSRPVVWISWHEGNLLTLAVHQRILRRVGIAFVPPGLRAGDAGLAGRIGYSAGAARRGR